MDKGNIENCSFQELIGHLKNDTHYSANKEFATRIVLNDTEAVHYFLTDYSEPIIKHIELDIMKRDVYGDYYIFISAPIDDEQKPRWRKIELYKGDDCKLNTYVTCISCRHFCKLAKKEKEISLKNEGLIEYVDYETLLNCDKEVSDEESEFSTRMRVAYNHLKDKDKEVIRLLIIENMSSLEAFDILKHYVKPKAKNGMTSDEIKESWTTKQRQDIIALLKGRALSRLKKEFLNTKI